MPTRVVALQLLVHCILKIVILCLHLYVGLKQNNVHVLYIFLVVSLFISIRFDLRTTNRSYTSTVTEVICSILCMCGFLLAVEQKKRKTFFSHINGSLGMGVWGRGGGGVKSRGLCKVSDLILPSAIA